jgi:acetate---CoA ligase (ADP-forming)
LLTGHRPAGKRLVIVSDGGGSAVVAADLTAEVGLELPRLSPALSGRLVEVMPPTATTTNPVDFAGAGEQDLRTYERVPRLLLESEEVDAVLVTGYLGGYSVTSDELRGPETDAARGLARAAAELGKPVVVQTMYWQESPARALRSGGVPVFRDIRGALQALARVADHESRDPPGVPDLPKPSAPVAAEDYFGARALLASSGVAFADALPAATVEEVLTAAAGLGYPIVLKALGLVHKSDERGVAVGLEDETALKAAADEMAKRLSPVGFAVERMVSAPGSVELIVGCRRDPRFGPVLLVGLGGIFTEVMRDTAVALAPAAADEIESMLLGLQGSPLLTGARGRQPLAVRAAAEAAAALSRFAAEHPEIDEVEVNPLLVTSSGALALDARVLYSQPR